VRFNEPPIDILVGTNADMKRFYLDPVLLREHSKFFELALRQSWAEGQERVVKLLEIQSGSQTTGSEA
jgi:hypothetical protein